MTASKKRMDHMFHIVGNIRHILMTRKVALQPRSDKDRADAWPTHPRSAYTGLARRTGQAPRIRLPARGPGRTSQRSHVRGNGKALGRTESRDGGIDRGVRSLTGDKARRLLAHCGWKTSLGLPQTAVKHHSDKHLTNICCLCYCLLFRLSFFFHIPENIHVVTWPRTVNSCPDVLVRMPCQQ